MLPFGISLYILFVYEIFIYAYLLPAKIRHQFYALVLVSSQSDGVIHFVHSKKKKRVEVLKYL